MRVSNLTSPRSGEPVKNQFVIDDGDKEVFQSYETPIAKKDNSGYTISSNYNYSVTTGKYFNQWLRSWGFNDDEIKKLKKWLTKANSGDTMEMLNVNIKYVEEL